MMNFLLHILRVIFRACFTAVEVVVAAVENTNTIVRTVVVIAVAAAFVTINYHLGGDPIQNYYTLPLIGGRMSNILNNRKKAPKGASTPTRPANYSKNPDGPAQKVESMDQVKDLFAKITIWKYVPKDMAVTIFRNKEEVQVTGADMTPFEMLGYWQHTNPIEPGKQSTANNGAWTYAHGPLLNTLLGMSINSGRYPFVWLNEKGLLLDVLNLKGGLNTHRWTGTTQTTDHTKIFFTIKDANGAILLYGQISFDKTQPTETGIIMPVEFI